MSFVSELLFSSGISGVSFNFKAYVKIEIPGERCTPPNCLGYIEKQTVLSMLTILDSNTF